MSEEFTCRDSVSLGELTQARTLAIKGLSIGQHLVRRRLSWRKLIGALVHRKALHSYEWAEFGEDE